MTQARGEHESTRHSAMNRIRHAARSRLVRGLGIVGLAAGVIAGGNALYGHRTSPEQTRTTAAAYKKAMLPAMQRMAREAVRLATSPKHSNEFLIEPFTDSKGAVVEGLVEVLSTTNGKGDGPSDIDIVMRGTPGHPDTSQPVSVYASNTSPAVGVPGAKTTTTFVQLTAPGGTNFMPPESPLSGAEFTGWAADAGTYSTDSNGQVLPTMDPSEISTIDPNTYPTDDNGNPVQPEAAARAAVRSAEEMQVFASAAADF